MIHGNCYFIRTLEESTALFLVDYHEPHNHLDKKFEKYRWKIIIETFDFQGSVHRKCIPKYDQQDATLHIFLFL